MVPYPGQFHFLGRLDRPFEEITRDSMPAWAASHPLGLVVREVGSRSRAAGALIDFGRIEAYDLDDPASGAASGGAGLNTAHTG